MDDVKLVGDGVADEEAVTGGNPTNGSSAEGVTMVGERSTKEEPGAEESVAA